MKSEEFFRKVQKKSTISGNAATKAVKESTTLGVMVNCFSMGKCKTTHRRTGAPQLHLHFHNSVAIHEIIVYII
jgi:hypothetical protein